MNADNDSTRAARAALLKWKAAKRRARVDACIRPDSPDAEAWGIAYDAKHPRPDTAAEGGNQP